MRLEQWAPWVITTISLTTQWMIGNKNKLGFAIGAPAHVIVCVYNVATGQFGFIPANLFACLVACRNYKRWSRDERELGLHAGGEGGDLARR